jgi:hypothetical protein
MLSKQTNSGAINQEEHFLLYFVIPMELTVEHRLLVPQTTELQNAQENKALAFTNI